MENSELAGILDGILPRRLAEAEARLRIKQAWLGKKEGGPAREELVKRKFRELAMAASMARTTQILNGEEYPDLILEVIGTDDEFEIGQTGIIYEIVCGGRVRRSCSSLSEEIDPMTAMSWFLDVVLMTLGDEGRVEALKLIAEKLENVKSDEGKQKRNT